MTDFNHKFLGRQSLQYLGNRAPTPPNIVKLKRDPTTSDYKEFIIGDFWLNTSTNGLWYLADLLGNVATWVQITGGAAALDTLTGDTGGAVPPDISDNINILGGTGIQVNGNAGTNTLTIEGIDPIATQYDADSGSATPNSGVLNLVGGGALSTSATGNTVTFTDGGLVASQYTADSGTAVPSGNNLNVFGGSGINTSGAGDTLTITADGTVPLSFPTDSGTAAPLSNQLTLAGGDGISTTGSGATATFSITNYQARTGFTPSVDGSTSGPPTIAVAAGAWARMGTIVNIQIELTWTALNGASGDIIISNLPITIPGSLNRNPLGVCWLESLTWQNSGTQALLFGVPGTTTARVYITKSGSTPQIQQIGANGTIHANITFGV